MRKHFLVLLALAALPTAFALKTRAEAFAGTLVHDALSEDAGVADAAIAGLRALGPEGVEAMLRAHAPRVAELRDGASPRPDLDRFRHALDRVCAQYDCWASGLYWHTDLGAAWLTAVRERKPILSLRLLGRLDEEMSCANSRFFRAALYADPEVSRLLRERFVLHWVPVRPAPRVTIDFGDGRVLERTITGNSVHLVLDPQLRPIDALPGLYGPGTFLAALSEAAALAASLEPLDPDARRSVLTAHHGPLSSGEDATPDGTAPDAVPAEVAMPIAATKMMVESPLLRGVRLERGEQPEAGRGAGGVGTTYGRRPDEPPSRAILRKLQSPPVRGEEAGPEVEALRFAADSRLDAASIALLKRHNPALDDEALARMVARFEQSLAVDTARNERMLRPVLRGWLASGEYEQESTSAAQSLSRPGAAAERLTARIYDQLFLTPGADPWLGLRDPDVYSGLENDGVR